MGNDAVVYNGEYSTWCPSRLQNQPSTSGATFCALFSGIFEYVQNMLTCCPKISLKLQHIFIFFNLILLYPALTSLMGEEVVLLR